MIDFSTIDYLKNGNPKQKKAYETLKNHRIFEQLSEFSPLLAGTIPIEIDIENSDLDILCEVKNQAEFLEKVKNKILIPNKIVDFQVEKIEDYILISFQLGEFPIEIFGQNRPTFQQNAYRHLLAEYRILQEKGEDFRRKIIELKKNGIKTEPAFGKLLNLKNPYEDLLNY